MKLDALSLATAGGELDDIKSLEKLVTIIGVCI